MLEKIKNNGFAKSVMILVSGTIIGQIINFVGMPVIGRIYSPNDIGDYTLITSTAAIILSFACLGMMVTFLLPKSDEEARGLSRLVACLTICISGVTVLILFFISDYFKAIDTEEVSYTAALGVLWVYIVTSNIASICYSYCNRHKLYKIMFWNPIITAGTNIALGIIFGLLGWGFVGYTLAHIFSFIFKIIHLSRHSNAFAKIYNPEYRFRPLLKAYSRFPKFQMPANIISNLAKQMPVQMIGLVFGGTVLGMYAMAMKLLAVPALIIAGPINRVYYKESNDRYNSGQEIGEFAFKLLKVNIKLALVPIVILIIFGEPIFALILGEEWREAGQFAAILGAYELMYFCTQSLAGGMSILGKNKVNFYISIFQLIVNSMVFLIVFLYNPQEYIIAIYMIGVAGFITRAISLGVFFHYANVSIKKYVIFLAIYIIIPYTLAVGIKFFLF